MKVESLLLMGQLSPILTTCCGLWMLWCVGAQLAEIRDVTSLPILSSLETRLGSEISVMQLNAPTSGLHLAYDQVHRN